MIAPDEILTGIPFQTALRHATRFHVHSPIGDPLDAAVRKIEQNPAFSQCRLLTRVLDALAYGRGEFRRAELAAFDEQTLAIVVGLLDLRAAGTLANEDLERAADAALAAQRSTED